MKIKFTIMNNRYVEYAHKTEIQKRYPSYRLDSLWVTSILYKGST